MHHFDLEEQHKYDEANAVSDSLCQLMDKLVESGLPYCLLLEDEDEYCRLWSAICLPRDERHREHALNALRQLSGSQSRRIAEHASIVQSIIASS